MLILIKRCCAAEKRSWKIKSGIKAMWEMAKKNKNRVVCGSYGRYLDKRQPKNKTISLLWMMSRCVCEDVGDRKCEFPSLEKSGSSFCYKIFQVSQKNKPTKIIITSGC